MARAYKDSADSPVGEMAIVDTFTKLIFGEEQDFSPREVSIIEALRLVDGNVLLDSHRDMGDYLRALGVGEMIGLVRRVREQMGEGSGLAGANPRATPNPIPLRRG